MSHIAMKLPKISIVTVVYNAVDDFKVTAESIVNQGYNNLEFIVIDGGSTDGTLDLIKFYEKYISYWVSEPDGGIYDAMNKGVLHSTGDYINFMNAGDVFSSDNVVKLIASETTKNPGCIYVGGCMVKYPSGKIKVNSVSLSSTNNYLKMPVCHQSMFAPRELLIKYKLNEQYKIAADFDFFLAAIKAKVDIHILESNLSCITSGGVSDLKRVETLKEYQFIHEKNFGRSAYVSIYFFLNRLLERIKHVVKVILFRL